MADKKAADGDQTPEDEALQKRVEMIMGERNADGVTPARLGKSPGGEPEIDIFKDPKTAPAVSPHLLEDIGAAAAEPAKGPAKPAGPTAAPVAAAAPTAARSQPVATTEPATTIDDEVTDKAVDDIARTDSDAILAAEDQAIGQQAAAVTKPVKTKQAGRLTGWFKNKWFWIIALLVIVAAAFAVPYSRYTILGLFIKETVTVNVTDSKTHTPVSTAAVNFGSGARYTNGEGKVQLQVPLGKHVLSVTKQYYQGYTTPYTVTLNANQTVNVSLVATGRQVPVTVIDKISGKPLADARISVLDTSAKTNSKGTAVVVLPTKATTNTATISHDGYNNATVAITVTNLVIPANTFSLMASGQIYFLSNQSGKLDVVKSNLDGSNRTTVLAGTGREDPNNTSLLASRDWRYLVLEAQHDSSQPALYLINTDTDKVTNFDGGNASFTLIGWYGHNFLYDVNRGTVSPWSSGKEAVKSYNADNAQLNLIDQTQAEGSSSAYAYQSFYNFYIMNGLVSYNTQWYTYNGGGSSYDLSGKSDTIRGVQPNGQGKKDYQSFAAAGVSYIQAALYEPNEAYYAVYNYGNNTSTYYKFDGQTVTTATDLSQADFNKGYPTYLLSPAGSQTFWTELRDGKNTLFLGDNNAQAPKQIASLSDYAPYGWFTDNYLLVSKNSSELYIMPAAPLAAGQQPIKITDYYKPAQSFQGYGYGYGGL